MAAITAEGLYQVFGRRPKRGVAELKQGKTREDLQEQGLTAAVIDATFSVDPGEIFVVMGLSGSGKSTLIRMINGLFEPTDGTVTIGDEIITNVSAEKLRAVRRKKISMVFQHFALLPHRTVGENAAYGLKVQGMNRTERESAANKALKEVGLDGWGDYLPSQLSGGMQQRVGLARALAAGTDIMLMDEAFSALDPLIRRGMQDQLIELQQRLEKTILFITHDLNEAMRLGDRIAMMRDGQIEQVGTAEQILTEPTNNYVASFIQDVDRTRVLTAANIMEPPAAVIGSGSGPQAAHKVMRESQVSWLLVQNRDRTPEGILWMKDVAEAVRTDRQDLPWSPLHEMPTVSQDTPLADLFAVSALHLNPIVVTDGEGRTVGVIPRVTLLAAAANHGAGADMPELDENGKAVQPGGTTATKKLDPAAATGADGAHTREMTDDTEGALR